MDEKRSSSFSVYIHQNQKNQKIYVGITDQVPCEKRWNHGNGYKNNKKFYQDIKKFGFDNFEHRVVCTGLTEEQAVKIEKELIRAYDSVFNGYNNSFGGKYATKTNLNSTANKLKNGFKRHEKDFIRKLGFSPYELFVEAEKAGADSNICQNLNIHCEKIIEIFFHGEFCFYDLYDLSMFWGLLVKQLKLINAME